MKLCYVEGNWAYFTDRPLTGEGCQWGDDWNDAPYEHNAEPPYVSGGEKVEVIGFMGADLETPSYTSLSVERINAGVVPWLATPSWSSKEVVTIFAGADMAEFKDKVQASGGQVYTLENV